MQPLGITITDDMQRPRRDADEEMGDPNIQTNAKSTEAPEDARRREAELHTKVREQEEMLAVLKRQLEVQKNGKGKEKENPVSSSQDNIAASQN
jgi:hypothetical protein